MYDYLGILSIFARAHFSPKFHNTETLRLRGLHVSCLKKQRCERSLKIAGLFPCYSFRESRLRNSWTNRVISLHGYGTHSIFLSGWLVDGLNRGVVTIADAVHRRLKWEAERVWSEHAGKSGACIRNVSGSNLGRNTCYPCKGFLSICFSRQMIEQYLS
jgi:hypothetical protein